jgi:hypothetical protein
VCVCVSWLAAGVVSCAAAVEVRRCCVRVLGALHRACNKEGVAKKERTRVDSDTDDN